jgi:hypothetical protein
VADVPLRWKPAMINCSLKDALSTRRPFAEQYTS